MDESVGSTFKTYLYVGDVEVVVVVSVVSGRISNMLIWPRPREAIYNVVTTRDCLDETVFCRRRRLPPYSVGGVVCLPIVTSSTHPSWGPSSLQSPLNS